MPTPIITLTTDFGLADHFVASMKGVILSITPSARIVDVSHAVPAFDVSAAAFLIAETYPAFPSRTVHVVVCDPGVGSDRRPILVEAGGQYFLGPDNGVFSMIRAAEPRNRVRVISNAKVMRKEVSRTFHGRDIFAPAAAHLVKGKVPVAQFGKLTHDALQLRLAEPEQTNKRTWTGVILKVDHFGNMITNFRAASFDRVRTSPFEAAVGFEKIRRLALHYAECPPGEPFLIEGSSGYFEISMNQASAARQLGCSAGAPVELSIW
jgi:S-adenosylmethionine hydrolase